MKTPFLYFPPYLIVGVFFTLLLSFASAASETAAEAPSKNAPKTILQWKFDGAKEAGEWQGALGKGDGLQEGPLPDRYPGFEKGNKAGYFQDKDAFLVVKDRERGGSTDVRFALGDTFFFETWVKIKEIKPGETSYLIGKGRHGKLGVNLGEMNQNYAVRLKGANEGAEIGFLFTSIDPAQKGKRDWHRWTSKQRIPASGWHHLSVTYTFGKKDSLAVRIDNQITEGIWDMGGATDLGPVTDADDLVIGTGYQRSAAESFTGWLDNLTLSRGAPDPVELEKRYTFIPPPPPVNRQMIPTGQVLVQISEKGVPEANAWPEAPEVTESFTEDVFGLFDLPQKYISTGVRGDRANPCHIRASAVVTIPAGKHRILLRSRGASRLYIDGKQLLENPFPPNDPAGHHTLSMQDDYLDLGPGFRFAPPGNRDAWCEFTSTGGEQFVILETLIGGIMGKSKHRPELGETVVAISPEGSEHWSILSPGKRQVAYTDAGWNAYAQERRTRLDAMDTKARAEKRAEHAAYWNMRRKAAEEWLTKVTPISIPKLPEGYPAQNPIDHFIADRIVQAKEDAKLATSASVDYFKEVRPLLEAKCYGCHQGGKAKGKLRLDIHETALKGGKSDGPSVVPGDPDESSLILRISPDAGDDIMPPKEAPFTAEQIALLTRWIKEGAPWPQFDVKRFDMMPLAEDLVFLRRVFLDIVGVPPSEKEIAQFQNDPVESRRTLVIDRLLQDSRWADHWMDLWQDALAENPNILNPTLNNTGPFRWWLYESLLDNKPADLFVTELLRMEGSERFGGPAGFAIASQNDVPMAAKGMIVSGTFLGVEMKCARCHDSTTNVSKQRDLFELAAMMEQAAIQVPATSSVPLDRLQQTGREPLIEITLEPGANVEPAWPFPQFIKEEAASTLAENPQSSRDRLAALITAPENQRFAQVIVNRLWERLMGRGLVSTLEDWEKTEPSHPELLAWLGQELVRQKYDMKAIARLILNSHAYQRAVDPQLTETSPLFLATAPRRLTAEQIVDSLFSATGAPFDVEEFSLDIDSVRDLKNSITLGKPRRAWMLASTSNERDRPSLTLPRVQAVASLMETFGWRGARQDPVHHREINPNVLQSAILANGTVGVWLTGLSDRHSITQLALSVKSPEELVDRLFLRLLTRHPDAAEKESYTAYLENGFADRIVPESDRPKPAQAKHAPPLYVSWSNHLDGPANTLATDNQEAARLGDPPTTALREEWRKNLEDVIWAMLNATEWIYSS